MGAQVGGTAMAAQDWWVLIQVTVDVAIVIMVFIGKNWLKAGIQHGFDQELEAVRSELRASEERLNSELRAKETEISALRDGILGGRAQRQALIDRRRLEAVERIWTRVSTTLGAYKTVASWMSVVKFDAIAEVTPTNAGARQMFEAMLAHIPEDDGKVNNVNPERIFVSPLAWAYFSAYHTMMYTWYASAKVLAMGIETPTRYFDFQKP